MIWKDSPTLNHLNSCSYGSVPFIGKGKSFKTGTMYSVIEACPDLLSRPKAFYDFPSVDIFPPGFGAYGVSSVDDVEPGSILILEDANRIIPSREPKLNIFLQKFIGLISHKDILCMLTIQSTGNVDQCVFRDQEVINIHKLSDPVGLAYERDEFRDFCSIGNILISEFSESLGIDWHYISFVPRFAEVLVMDPPDWYGKRHSCALRDYKLKGVPECRRS